MTRNTCADRGTYVESPLPDEPCAKETKGRDPFIPVIPSTRSNMPLWKAIAFVGRLLLARYSAPLHAALTSDTVQSLYDALLSTMKNGSAIGPARRPTTP